MDPEFQMPPGPHSHDLQNVIPMLLATARLKMSLGDPSAALQAVIAALRLYGGEESVLLALARAREAYQKKITTNVAVDELAALFAECAVIEANVAVPMGSLADNIVNPDEHSNFDSQIKPILAESGRMQVVLDASSDGSSFICLQCGGLVSKLRRDEHMSYWCTHSS